MNVYNQCSIPLQIHILPPQNESVQHRVDNDISAACLWTSILGPHSCTPLPLNVNELEDCEMIVQPAEGLAPHYSKIVVQKFSRFCEMSRRDRTSENVDLQEQMTFVQPARKGGDASGSVDPIYCNISMFSDRTAQLFERRFFQQKRGDGERNNTNFNDSTCSEKMCMSFEPGFSIQNLMPISIQLSISWRNPQTNRPGGRKIMRNTLQPNEQYASNYISNDSNLQLMICFQGYKWSSKLCIGSECVRRDKSADVLRQQGQCNCKCTCCEMLSKTGSRLMFFECFKADDADHEKPLKVCLELDNSALYCAPQFSVYVPYWFMDRSGFHIETRHVREPNFNTEKERHRPRYQSNAASVEIPFHQIDLKDVTKSIFDLHRPLVRMHLPAPLSTMQLFNFTDEKHLFTSLCIRAFCSPWSVEIPLESLEDSSKNIELRIDANPWPFPSSDAASQFASTHVDKEAVCKKILLPVGVCVESMKHPFQRSKLVTFSPGIMVLNLLSCQDLQLKFGNSCGSSSFATSTLKKMERAPIFWTESFDSEKFLQIRYSKLGLSIEDPCFLFSC
jgi:hypothetical protein